MQVAHLSPDKEQALIKDLTEKAAALEVETLKTHGLTYIEGILVLKSLALAKAIQYAIICGLTKEQFVEENNLVYDVMTKEFEKKLSEAKADTKPSEGTIPSP